MEVAKITSRGQITIPIDIRKKLGVKEGDKVIFIEDDSRILVANAAKIAFTNMRAAFLPARRIGSALKTNRTLWLLWMKYGRRYGKSAMRIMIDTNVLISAFVLSSSYLPGQPHQFLGSLDLCGFEALSNIRLIWSKNALQASKINAW